MGRKKRLNTKNLVLVSSNAKSVIKSGGVIFLVLSPFGSTEVQLVEILQFEFSS